MSKVIGINPTGKRDDPLYWCHPVCYQNEILKIIQGDMRVHTWVDDSNTTHTAQSNSGTLIYDKENIPRTSWFVLAYESGDRVEQ